MQSESTPPAKTWDSGQYLAHAGFVPALGDSVLELLAPAPGEAILDLGCGDGSLTEKIAARGAKVTGVDSSPEMIATAQARQLHALVVDGMRLSFDGEFDAVFSNAALHWMKADPDAVVAGVKRALKPGGRFVAECGGHGNVAAIVVAISAVLERHDVNPAEVLPWYFPTADEYRARLERHGFTVDHIALIPRPTLLPSNMEGWLSTFADGMLARLPADRRAGALADIVRLLRPALCDRNGQWTADYVRLRFSAHL